MQTSFWDMSLSSPSSKTITVAKSCDSEPEKDGSPACKCGKGTSACTIHPSTKAEWIRSQRAGLARTLALLEEEQGLTVNTADSFSKSSGSPAYYDHATSSWKTHQLSLLGDSTGFSDRWSSSGMIADGRYYPQRIRLPRKYVPGGGALPLYPTPTVTDSKDRTYQVANGRKLPTLAGAARGFWRAVKASDAQTGWIMADDKHASLRDQVKMYPAPAARDHRSGKGRKDNGHTPQLPEVIGGQLSPEWVEWLMGFPTGATELRD